MRIRENRKLFPLSLCPAAAWFCDGLLGSMAIYFSLKHTYLKSALQGSLRKGVEVRGTGKEKGKEKEACNGKRAVAMFWRVLPPRNVNGERVAKATKRFRRRT